MSVIDRLEEALGAEGFRLRRARPRGVGRLTLEVVGPTGRVAAGQWFAEPAHATEEGRLLSDRFGTDAVMVLDGGRLLLQLDGADRRLPALRALASRPGAVVVSHQAERRAVVRLRDGRYVKVVRPGRVHELVAPLASLRLPAVQTPRVLDVDEARGCVTTARMPGRTLHEILLDPDVPVAEVVGGARATGAALRALHHQGLAPTRTPHTGEAELAAARRWLDAAVDHGLLHAAACARACAAVATRLLRDAEPTVAVHRDFHDKQVLLDGDGVGILDLDLAAAGEPSVDVANLVAHLHLRSAQGMITEERAASAETAFLEGYGDPEVSAQRFAAYLASTRLRLAGVYAFRPSRPGLSDVLLEQAADPALALR